MKLFFLFFASSHGCCSRYAIYFSPLVFPKHFPNVCFNACKLSAQSTGPFASNEFLFVPNFAFAFAAPILTHPASQKKFFRAYFFFLFFLDTQNQHFSMKVFHHLFAQSLPRFFTTFPVPYVLANKNFCLRKIFSFLWMFKILQNNFSWPSRKIPPFHMPVSPRPLVLFR